VLRRYERERRSEATLAARAFDLIQRGFAPSFLPLAAARGTALAAAGALPPIRHLLADLAAGR
jgi:2-octaprenyl-3-methyl-6-methoxy-1,4-benzoquinol hydroxylase/2-octaprenylphenol hydroxylase